jgi:hypothetical protein
MINFFIFKCIFFNFIEIIIIKELFIRNVLLINNYITEICIFFKFNLSPLKLNFKLLFQKGGNRPSNSEHIPMDDVYYVVPGPEDQVDGEDAEPKVYVSTTQGLKKVVERRHSQNSDRLT